MKKKVTICDIAALTGVSAKAVSLALNGGGRLAPATRRRIIEKARELHYTPNASARTLVSGKSFLIGVLLPYLNSSFFNRIIAGIECSAAREGFSILLGLLQGGSADHDTLNRMLGHPLDGMIFFGETEILPDLQLLGKSDLPMLQVMTTFPQTGNCCFAVDNHRAGAEALDALYKNGRRNIAMLTHDRVDRMLSSRHSGFAEMFQSRFGADRTPLTAECTMDSASGYQTFARLWEKHPEIDAVFAASDYAALGVLEYALKHAIKVPEQLAIIGFDDLDIAAQQLQYPLSTMVQPKEELGEAAGKGVFQLIQGKEVESRLFPAPLIVRATGGDDLSSRH